MRSLRSSLKNEGHVGGVGGGLREEEGGGGYWLSRTRTEAF